MTTLPIKSYVERIERLEEEKSTIAEDIASVYKEAKERGVHVKALREVIKLRKLEKDEREALQDKIADYMSALGMLADTPLGRAAIERASAH